MEKRSLTRPTLGVSPIKRGDGAVYLYKKFQQLVPKFFFTEITIKKQGKVENKTLVNQG